MISARKRMAPRPDAAQDARSSLALRIASSFDDYRRALQLVQRTYERAGLATPNAAAMRLTRYHLLPTTQLLLVGRAGQLMGTATLIMDGVEGLPMEVAYPQEVTAKRHAALRMAEVSCLADDVPDESVRFAVLQRLMSYMAQIARCHSIDEVLIAVHPRHARFYARYLGFVPIGEERAFPHVRNQPAVPLAIDLRRLHAHHAQGYERLFGTRLPPHQFHRRPITGATWERLRECYRAASHASRFRSAERQISR